MKAHCVFLVLIASTLWAHAEDKPVAYDHITKDGAAIDQQVFAALARNYNIKPIEDSPAYIPSKAISGTLPSSAKSASGEPMTGYVLVAFVVSARGHAVDPVVLKTTDPRLNSIALKSMADWKFNPAQLNGVPIATTAAQEFNFTLAAAAKGFAVRNIVLYQPNDVLKMRLSGPDDLAAYIQKLQAILTDYFQNATTPETLDIVVAVRPGNLSRIWFIPSSKSGILAPLREKLDAVRPMDVREGPVAFAISANLAGGDGRDSSKGGSYQLPVPKEWRDAAKELKPPILMPDGFLNVVWPAGK